MTSTEWKKQASLRALWAQFRSTEAFIQGLAYARWLNRPSLIVGEPPHVTASRHAFQAGFEAALRAIEKIDTLQTATTQEEVIPEWEHIRANQIPIE